MKKPYVKAALLALLLHMAVLGLAGLVAGRIAPPPAPPPIAIEIEPPKILSMGSGLQPASGGAAPAGPKAEEKPKAAAKKKELSPIPVAKKPEVKPKVKPRPQVLKREVKKRPSRPKPAPERMRTVEPLPPALPAETTPTSVALPARGDSETEAKSQAPGANGPQGSNDGGAAGGRSALYGGGGQGGTGGGGAYTGAGYRSGPLPVYPASERSSGREGVVTVRILIGTDGVPVSVSVRNTSGSEDFDGAAVAAVKKWRFSPAKKDGAPVSSFFDVRVRFRLNDAR
ncbi:MAG: TonB family protein [Syntrophobacteraceae bacterium]|nr:TonB family protein [Syntrophobacteraceae bacterium]